jgi:hypothetical protein
MEPIMNVGHKRRSDYHAYLLRVWRDGPQAPWRASLQRTTTEQMYHFATIEALFAFLDGCLTHDGDGTTTTEEQP